MTWAGVDLAALESRPSAVAIGSKWEDLALHTVYKDAEILDLLAQAEVIWIDAPLTIGKGAFRDCDRLLHEKRITPLPLTWSSMQRLHARATRLRQSLSYLRWYETFPWSVYRWLGATSGRKKAPILLAQWLPSQVRLRPNLSIHEWDALACWILGWLQSQGKALCLQGKEGEVWIPDM